MPNPRSWRYSPMFPSKSFTIFALAFSSGPLWVPFSVWWKVRIWLHSYACGYPVEKTVLSPSKGLGAFSKINRPFMWQLMSGLSLFLVYISVLLPIPYCFPYCSLVVKYWNWNLCVLLHCCSFSRFFWLSGVLLHSIWILAWIFLFLKKNAIWILIGILLNL